MRTKREIEKKLMEMGDFIIEEKGFTLLQPGHIVISSAALLGLVITALGALIALSQGNIQIVRNFAFFFVGVVILFMVSVLLTCLLTITPRRRFFWRAAIYSYTLGWAFLGTVVSFILCGYIVGVEALQPQLPQFNPYFLLWLIYFPIGIIYLVGIAIFPLILHYRFKKRVRKIRVKVAQYYQSELKDASEKMQQLLSKQTNPIIIMAELRIEIERELRRIASEAGVEERFMPIYQFLQFLQKKGAIDRDLVALVEYIYSRCIRAAYRARVRKETALRILDLGPPTLVALKRITLKK